MWNGNEFFQVFNENPEIRNIFYTYVANMLTAFKVS